MITEASRELCFKHAVDGVSTTVALRHPVLWVGILLWIVELIAWVRVLETVPLTIAFPLMAVVYIVTQLGAVTFLKEKLTPRHGMGALLIAIGVACIGSTGI